jgi:hypothetical protein
MEIIFQWLAIWLIPAMVVVTMSLYRMYDDNGRRCLTGKQILVELPGFFVVCLICAGMIEFYHLGPQASMAVFATFSWLGPRVILGFFMALIRVIEGKIK